MAITPRFTAAEVGRTLQRKLANIEQAIVTRLADVGESFVTRARSINTYIDQTGNLRSSIGFVVLKDGRQLNGSAFDVVKDGHKGRQIGLDTVKKAAAQHRKGYVLIVVAGMNYAAHVESGGRDVLSKSSVVAEKDLKDALNKLTKKLG